MDKLGTVAATMWGDQGDDKANAKHIAFIIGEMRLCAGIMASGSANDRMDAIDRLARMIAEPATHSMPTDADYLAALGPCNK